MERISAELMQKFANLMQEFDGSGQLFLCLEKGKRYSIAQIARCLSVSPPNVINLIGYGKLKASKGGKHGYLGVECADFIEFLKVHRPCYAYVVTSANMLIH